MELTQLQDFHPQNTGLVQPVLELMEQYSDRSRSSVPCGKDAFLALLAAVPSLQNTPGLPTCEEVGPSFFTALPKCNTDEQSSACRAYLEGLGITNAETLVQYSNKQVLAHAHYLDFEAFWEGRPPFDPTRMNERGLQLFHRLRDFTAQFYTIVGRHGFLAWDISQCAGLLRAAYACEVISHDELNELTAYWLEEAQTFESWTEYAVSLVCGQLYWDFRGGIQLPELETRLEQYLTQLRSLLDNSAAWGSGLWYELPQKKPYAMASADFRFLLRDWMGPSDCFATDHITVLGKKVGYCYREEPEADHPDSGWRFFSGEESLAYANDPDNFDFYDLNTICNYDPDIIPLLNAPYGTAYVRNADGTFSEKQFTPPEDQN